MRYSRTSLAMALYAASMLVAAHAIGQPANSAPTSRSGAQTGNRGAPAIAHSDSALEIMPRALQATPPPEGASSPVPGDSVLNPPEEVLPALPTSGPPSSMVASSRPPALPYLGVSVQRIESHSVPGHDVEGLEIISVDPNSPAEHAGLKGRGSMTKLGATGATAGALMAPLDIVMMPLLKKSGQLGQTGDLILEIDDQRVTDQADLENALANSKPGDTLYVTVARLNRSGSRQTMKIPCKLSEPLDRLP